MCLELINNIAEKTDVQTCNAFFNQFFITILQDVFFVLTDPDHKAGFKTQSMLLMRLFYFVHPADGSQPKIQGPVYQPDQAQPGTSNREFLGNFVSTLLQNAFANLTPYVFLFPLRLPVLRASMKKQADRSNAGYKSRRLSRVSLR